VDCVRFQVGENNIRSRRAMEHLGAVLIGGAPVRYFEEPAVQNVIYQINRDDWIGRVRCTANP